jgi:hypothetical protein
VRKDLKRKRSRSYSELLKPILEKRSSLMIDLETFIPTRDVMIDDCCQSERNPERPKRGPAPSLSRSEVMTLALSGQWVQFPRERAFYRSAQHHLRDAFPRLPNRSQWDRLQRSYRDEMTRFALFLVQHLQAQQTAYEVLDSTAAVTRDAKRRGLGWLAGQADIGWSKRVGWYEGFPLVLCVTAQGVITGFGFGSARTHDHHLAGPLFAARHTPSPRLLSAGSPAHGSSVADTGFAGDRPRQQWTQSDRVDLVTPAHQRSKQRWPTALRRWLAGLRHISETVNDKLLNTFRLARERPHALDGFQGRLAAKVAWYNVCIWLNVHRDAAPLAFAEFLAW